MSRIFDAAINHQFITDNPVRRTKKMRRRQGDKVLVQQHWSLDECRKALEVSKGTRFELFLHLAIYTGMRHGELLALSWDDIDFDAATLIIRRTIAEPKGARGPNGDGVTLHFNEPKTERGKRTLTLSPDLIGAFLRHRRQQEVAREDSTEWYGSDCVFTTSNGKPFWPSNFSGYFRKFLKDSGLRHIRVHDIRHSFAVNALELGIDLPSISRALGHGSLQITMDIYGRGAHDLQNRATNAIAKYFDES
jgi:integrase